MSRDGIEGDKRRPRPIKRPSVPPGPLADLKVLLYELYVQADRPSLDDIAAAIAADDDLPGAPARDSVNRIIGSPQLPPNQADVVAVVRVLARQARWDEADAAAQARSLWTAAQLAASRAPDRLGRPIAGLNPLALEVHPAITAGPAAPDHDDVLPAYIRRAHDDALDAIVKEGQTGACRLVVLVGDSSTGKTRACWEAVRSLGEPWRLWHPFNPGKPAAAVADLARVGPHTVVWLNETQHYLMTTDPAVGEQIAAELRELLDTPERGPVLVVGTLWREYWETLTTPPGSPFDPYAQARELLKGTSISMPETFTGADHEAAICRAEQSGDPRLAEALSRAASGHLTQYLAGGPALIDRYDKAGPAAQAIVEAAIDARRLGHGPALPRRFLEEAAAGYLTQEQWDLLPNGWLERAFAYLTDPEPCRGTRPPLTRIRPRPGSSTGSADMDGGEPCYRLADYLEQHGSLQRHPLCPPAEFWQAAAVYATDRVVLGEAAEVRYRYRHAAALFQAAADADEANGLQTLIQFWMYKRGHIIDDLLPRIPAALTSYIGTPVPVNFKIPKAALEAKSPAVMNRLHSLEWLAIRDQAGVEQAAWAAADAGLYGVLWHVARQRWHEEGGGESRWRNLLWFGLEADGRISDPW
ncbi:hypothetical protein [Streptosporangium sp. NPDC002721]|uniref:hypothetical protein n=1 Tax=Streptosporangium sp. NPDC002721 TaxID=3366188 RepID=UPI0036B96EBA